MLYRKLLVIGYLVFISAAVQAADSERHQRVDGIDVYLGVMPAQLTQEHPDMHGGASAGSHRYHLLVAMFDTQSGRRITDASVKAKVSPLGLGGTTKTLEPMQEVPISFGNYFILHQSGLHRIRLEIRPAGTERIVVADFIYQRPMD